MKNLIFYLVISLGTFGLQYSFSKTDTQTKNLEVSKSESVVGYRAPSEKKTTKPTVAKPLESIIYYNNSFGETVQSPTKYSAIPSGASAICYDGTYSFSRNRRGTCSGHGGVQSWL